MMRDLNLVRCITRALLAASCGSVNTISVAETLHQIQLTLSSKTTKAMPLLWPPTFMGILTFSTAPNGEKAALTSCFVADQSTLAI